MILIDYDWVVDKLKKALDAISKQMMDASIGGDVKCIEAGQNQYSAYSTALKLLRCAPTIEAAPVRRGEWEVVTGVMTPGGDPLLRCPFCKSKESHHMGGIEFPQDWDYCPKCGADMRKGCVE